MSVWRGLTALFLKFSDDVSCAVCQTIFLQILERQNKNQRNKNKDDKREESEPEEMGGLFDDWMKKKNTSLTCPL